MDDAAGKKHAVHMALRASPSVLFDAVAVLAGPEGDAILAANPDAVSFLMDAKRHLKAIALSGVSILALKTGVSAEIGVTDVDTAKSVAEFIKFAQGGKVWEREAAVTPPPAKPVRKR